MTRTLLLCLLLAGCADSSGYYSPDPADTIAARVAEGATLCHEPARNGVSAFNFTTDSPATCRSVGGIPARLAK
jgi:hypothetical protein